MKRLMTNGVGVIVYEPVLDEAEFFNSKVFNDLAAFKAQVDLIVTNRVTHDISDVLTRVYTGNFFRGDNSACNQKC